MQPTQKAARLIDGVDSKSKNFTRNTASHLKAIEEVNVTGIEKSDY
jgi:hypothetical protein